MSDVEKASATDLVLDRDGQKDLDEADEKVDLLEYQFRNAGSLVISPEYVVILFENFDLLIRMELYREALVEFGPVVAAKLKMNSRGTKVLWPQPTDDPDDPQNVRIL